MEEGIPHCELPNITFTNIEKAMEERQRESESVKKSPSRFKKKDSIL